MAALRALNLALTFVLEIAAVVAIAYWCWTLDGWLRVVLGVLVPLAVIAFWAVWMAPTARRRIGWPVRPVVAAALFTVGALALLDRGHVLLGWTMVVLIVVNTAGVLGWHQDAADARPLTT